MKTVYTILIAVALVCLCSCSDAPVYDSEVCADLAVKIERRDSLTQRDYALMIAQDEAIIRYLIEQSKTIAEEPQSDRNASWRSLLADPEYLERFSYMFTIGSALYTADLEGRLDETNKKNYDALDRFNRELADYSDMD